MYACMLTGYRIETSFSAKINIVLCLGTETWTQGKDS